MKNKQDSVRSVLLALIMILFSAVLMADETDIYYAQSTAANPNVLFVLDNSGSMTATVPGSGGKSRMTVMQEVLKNVLDAAPSNMNVGLMRYGGHTTNNANGVSFPVKPIDTMALPIIQASISPSQDNLPNPSAVTPVRTFASSIANSWTALGYTPIVDSLYEAALYYRGNPVDFGNLAASNVKAAHPSTYFTDNTLNCSTQTCNNSASQCTGSVVAGSCAKQWDNTSICKTWVTQTTPPSECCGGEVTVQVPSTCQNCVADAWDEAGKVTHQTCTNYACTKSQTSCLGAGGYTCGTATTEQVCSAYEQIQVDYCKQQVCAGGKRYLSPIQQSCQSNYIVLMSDGKPEYSGATGTATYPARKAAIQTLIGKGSNCGNDAPNGYKSGTCGPELTKFLRDTDQAPAVEGDQFIQTFTVGFGLEDATSTAYLQSLASVKEGSVAVNDADGLKLAFNNILKRVAAGTDPPLHLAGIPASGKATIPSKAAARQQLAVRKTGIQNLFATPLAITGFTDDEQQALASLFNPFSYWRTFAVGGFFGADDVNSLTTAFSGIINKITAAASSFSSPSYKVNQATLLEHAEDVYIPVFERSNLPLWNGNLRKFKRKANGELYGVDKTAVVNAKGEFLDSAYDFWSSAASGKDVTLGGAANKLPAPDSRTLYTDVSGSTLSILNNTNVTKTMLGDSGMTTAYQTQLIDFIRGKKADGTARNHMGDMLNGKPQIVTYGVGTATDPYKSYIFVASNEGYLHVIDAADAASGSSGGQELWAFMPQSLLKNIDIFYKNATPKVHVSGIDGALGVWKYDTNNDGKIVPGSGASDDKIYLYFGLRQGGSEYYMLDISVISSPKVVWHKTSQDTGFSELGQTWSKPALAKMRIADSSPENALTHASKLVDVLVFGGGYDPVKNTENTSTATRAADSKGRDVFIVKAQDGSLLWSLRSDVSGTASQLTDSIPGDIRVMDMDRNGALDRLYFADTGGNVWRVDMDTDTKDALIDTLYNYSKATLSKVAALGGSGINKRMFFYEPDVAMLKDKDQTILTLAIGSGYRTRPLNQGTDRFYVLIDRNPYGKPTSALGDSDLTSLADLGTATLLTDATLKGWYYNLPNTGEKVLASATTFLNKVVFTTFASADGVETDPCGVPPNSARAYVLDLFNGTAVANLDRSADGSKEMSVISGVNEILDAAQIIFRAPIAANGSDCTASDCQQSVEIRVGKTNLPLLDVSNTTGDTVSESANIGNILPRVFWMDHNILD
jgi:hypothetical protein